MKHINLTTGGFATINDQDYDSVNKFKWIKNNRGYAVTWQIDQSKRILMHRLILNPKKGQEVDHVNHNRLDNRRKNLRVCTKTENQWNRLKDKKRGTKYIGVYPHPYGYKTWIAVIAHRGKQIHITTAKTAEEAAYIRDQVTIQLRGKYAVTNFEYLGG